MVPIPKIIGVMSCGVVMCLTLSNAAIAAVSGGSDCAERKGGQPDLLKCDQEIRQGIETVRGEVLRVEGPNYFVKGKDGKEVRLHTDSTTLMMTGIIGKGDRVEALVNEQNHALSINKTSMKN
jgi:hypothetical protein